MSEGGRNRKNGGTRKRTTPRPARRPASARRQAISKWWVIAGVVAATYLGSYAIGSAASSSQNPGGLYPGGYGNAGTYSQNGDQGAGAPAGYGTQTGGGAAGGAYGQAGTGAGGAGGSAGAAGGGGCCGGGGGGTPQVWKTAVVKGSTQTVDMIVNNSWNPDGIKAKAGLPLKINLDVQAAGGCLSSLVFNDFGISQPLQSGTKATINLPTLKKGTYIFSCQMGMVNGQLVVE